MSSQKASAAFLAASAFAAIWTPVLLVFVATNTNGLSQVVASLGSLIAIVAAVVGMFQKQLPVPQIKDQRRAIAQVVTMVLILDICGTGGWAWWSYYRANTAFDVTVQTSSTGNINVMPGMSATFAIPLPVKRRSIAVTFQVVDHDKTLGSCTPETELSVTAQIAGAPSVPVTAISGALMDFPLFAQAREVRLTATVVNTREDQHCGVDLFVSKAVLVNN